MLVLHIQTRRPSLFRKLRNVAFSKWKMRLTRWPRRKLLSGSKLRGPHLQRKTTKRLPPRKRVTSMRLRSRRRGAAPKLTSPTHLLPILPKKMLFLRIQNLRSLAALLRNDHLRKPLMTSSVTFKTMARLGLSRKQASQVAKRNPAALRRRLRRTLLRMRIPQRVRLSGLGIMPPMLSLPSQRTPHPCGSGLKLSLPKSTIPRSLGKLSRLSRLTRECFTDLNFDLAVYELSFLYSTVPFLCREISKRTLMLPQLALHQAKLKRNASLSLVGQREEGHPSTFSSAYMSPQVPRLSQRPSYLTATQTKSTFCRDKSSLPVIAVLPRSSQTLHMLHPNTVYYHLSPSSYGSRVALASTTYTWHRISSSSQTLRSPTLFLSICTCCSYIAVSINTFICFRICGITVPVFNSQAITRESQTMRGPSN